MAYGIWFYGICIKKAGSESKVVGKKAEQIEYDTAAHILQKQKQYNTFYSKQIPFRMESNCEAFKNIFDVIFSELLIKLQKFLVFKKN